MTTNLNSGLSLLSRGIGEERGRSGHKKLEVCLEPQDYHNITSRKFYLPPLKRHAWPSTPAFPRQVSTHKTFTTRKGALLLYAEDLALTTNRNEQRLEEKTSRSLEAEDTSLFNTFDDLRSAILSYGAKETVQKSPQSIASSGGSGDSGGVYLGFVHSRHSFQTPRTIRPGFSAKRYLSSWSKSWDDTVLNDLRNKGQIWDKNLSLSVDTNARHRINDDLSRVPGPYRLTKNMLMAPGAAGSYEFYRVRAQSADSGDELDAMKTLIKKIWRPSEDDSMVNDDTSKSLPALPHVPSTLPNTGTIAAIVRGKDNKPCAVDYSKLDLAMQQEILQRLLMQSAIHKQQEVIENSAAMKALSVKSQEGSRDATPFDAVTGVNDLDIGMAIEALTTRNSVNLLDGEQVFDDHHLSDMYKTYVSQTPSVAPSVSSLKHTHPKPPQKVSFSHHPSLPPIKKSPITRQALKPSSAQLPVLDMMPVAPPKPKASLGGGSKRSVAASYSNAGSVRSSSGQWASEDSQLWQADIDENQYLQQEESADEQEYDGDAEGHVSVISKGSKVNSRKHSVAGSGHTSVAGSVQDDTEGVIRRSVAGSNKGVVAGSVKGSVAGSVRGSIAGSVRGSVAGSVTGSIAGSVAGSVAEPMTEGAVESTKESVAGSVIQSVTGSVKPSIAGSTKRSTSGSANLSIAGSVNLSVVGSNPRGGKTLSKHGSAVSLKSATVLVDSKPLSRSLDSSLDLVGSEVTSLKGSIKGGGIPKNHKEAMRAYKKGAGRSRSNSESGSLISGVEAEGDMLMILNIKAASSKASASSHASTDEILHKDDSAPQPPQDTLELVIPHVKLDEAELVSDVQDKLETSSVQAVQDESEPVQSSVETDQTESEPVQEAGKPVQEAGEPVQVESNSVGAVVNQDEDQPVDGEQPVNGSAEPTADTEGGDEMSIASEKMSTTEAPESVVIPTADPATEPTPDVEIEEGQHGSQQSVHVVDVGMGLPEAPSDNDDYASVVKSRRTHSVPASVAGSIKSMQDHPQDDMGIAASFHNFSYGSSNNSRKNSLDSADEDVLPIDDNMQTSGAESETEEQWLAGDGDKQLSESEQEDGTATETEEETDLEKIGSRVTSGKLSIASGSVRSISASVVGLNQRATPASQLVELEEHAAAVAAAVLMQRPLSERDLAMDAQIASELWTKKLSELFVQGEDVPERSRSAFVMRRRNSLDSEDSRQAEEDHLGRWTGPSFLAPKGQIKKESKRKRRVHSAKAAVRFIKELLRGEADEDEDDNNDKELEEEENLEELLLRAADEKEHIQLAPEILEIISNAGSIQANDIAIFEDQDQGKLIIRSRAPSAASVQSALSIRVPDLRKSRAASVDSPSDERAISVVASENIPSVVVQSEGDDTSEDEVIQDVSRVPSVAELCQILDEKATQESEDEEGLDEAAEDMASEKSNSQENAGGALSLDVTNIGKADKKEAEKQPLLVRPPQEPDGNIEEKKAEEDEALKQMIQDTGLLQKGKKSSKSSKSSMSIKSSKSLTSNSSKSSKDGKDKDEFVVKRTQDDKADHLLYKPLPEPEPKPSDVTAQQKGKKGGKAGGKKTKKPAAKKGKKKGKGEEEPAPAAEKPDEEKVEEKLEEKPPSEAAPEDELKSDKSPEGERDPLDDDELDSVSRKSPESPEFIFVDDEFSSSDEEPEPPPPPEPEESIAPTDDLESEYMSTITEDSTTDGGVSNQQAKAAKRAAEKEKRRLAVERKRQEREEARRKAIEKAELQEQLKKEYEEERKRKEEEIRMRKEQREADKLAAIEAEKERERQAALAAEKEKKQLDEYKKRMEEMARRKREEDQKRKEEDERRKTEDAKRRKAEQEMMAAMEEAERLEYEKCKREEELEAERRAEQERIRRELEARLAQAEAERLAMEIAKRQKEMERRLAFNRELQSESNVMSHSQDITRMFTWSYFELLDHLGIPIPEELKDHYEKEKETNSKATGTSDDG